MVHAAAGVEWTVVATEVESLQMEYSFIKQFSPRFNVKYRDDKSYPYLAVTLADEYPRVLVMRGDKRKGVKYFGPYTHAWAIRETVDLLLRVFPMRSCSAGVFRRARTSGRPCLLGYIDKCAAPCTKAVTPDEHRALALGLVNFMEGNTSGVVTTLRAEMEDASERLDFELAARRRDDLGALERVLEKTSVVFSDATDADVFALSADELAVSVYGFHVRGGRVRGQRGWVAEREPGASEEDSLVTALQHIYGELQGKAIPREVLTSHVLGGPAVGEWLSSKKGAHVDVRTPQRGDKVDLMATVVKNATAALASHKLKRASDLTNRSVALGELHEALELDEPPLRIECYDISTLHGNHTVGSMVVFEDGAPKKSDYRSFSVTGDAATDDLSSMRDVLTRRFKRLSEEPSPGKAEELPSKQQSFSYPPSLVVVDGGLPQVTAASEALADVGASHIHVVGLAKRLEEVWVPSSDYPVILPRSSEALYLLQHLRDEAHRFAIKHHRSKRAKAMTQSVLDDIPGIGPKRAAALLAEFGSVALMKEAGLERIAAMPGIGKATAQRIVDHLDATTSTSINTATGEVS